MLIKRKHTTNNNYFNFKKENNFWIFFKKNKNFFTQQKQLLELELEHSIHELIQQFDQMLQIIFHLRNLNYKKKTKQK